MNISTLLSKISLLRFHPEWVDGNPLGPQPPIGPIFSPLVAEYVVARLAKEISEKLSNRELSAKVLRTANEIVAEVARQLPGQFNVASEWDDLCPPYWHPIPHPRGGGDPPPKPWWNDIGFGNLLELIGPLPDPWLEASTHSMQDVALAVALRDLASVTTMERASAAFKEAGEALMKEASSRLFDDYCGTPVKPRVPTPRPVGPKKASAA
jgi:hypothetical protein